MILLGIVVFFYGFYLYVKRHQEKFMEMHLESANKRLIKALKNIENKLAEDQEIKKQYEKIRAKQTKQLTQAFVEDKDFAQDEANAAMLLLQQEINMQRELVEKEREKENRPETPENEGEPRQEILDEQEK